MTTQTAIAEIPKMSRYLFDAKNVGICAVVLGAGGFFAQLLVAQKLPSNIEFPNSLESVRIAAVDGRVYIHSVPLARVQRYGPDGFERAFAVERHGYFVGVSPSNAVLICSARARALITYDRDGNEIGERSPCEVDFSSSGLLPSPSYRANANVPAIASSWIAALAVPLWHPAVAWLMALVGLLILKFVVPKSNCGSGDP
jgi:hypothetical protein